MEDATKPAGGSPADPGPTFGPAETVAVAQVTVGWMLYSPESYPASLWGRVIGVAPAAGQPGYTMVDMDNAALPTPGNPQNVALKTDGVVRVKRPV